MYVKDSIFVYSDTITTKINNESLLNLFGRFFWKVLDERALKGLYSLYIFDTIFFDKYIYLILDILKI